VSHGALACEGTFERMEYVSPSMRELIMDVWPELAHKLPPNED
jgi:hypothetical protein